MIRFLSALTITSWLGAFLLLAVSDAYGSSIAALILILIGAVVGFFLAIRAAVLRVRHFASDVHGFVSGNRQEVRLVAVGDPKGWFSTRMPVTLEFEGADGKPHTYESEVPIPFPIAWSYRLAKRFHVPVLNQLDMSELLATELRREGMTLTASRPAQAP